jgi:hypothetical protein
VFEEALGRFLGFFLPNWGEKRKNRRQEKLCLLRRRRRENQLNAPTSGYERLWAVYFSVQRANLKRGLREIDGDPPV